MPGQPLYGPGAAGADAAVPSTPAGQDLLSSGEPQPLPSSPGAEPRTPSRAPPAGELPGWESGEGPGGGSGRPAGLLPATRPPRPGSPVWMRSPAVPLDLDLSSPLTYGTPSSRVEGTPRSGVRGTPVRQRPDLGSARKGLQVDLHSDGVSSGPVGARWGARYGRSPEPAPVAFSCAAGRRRYSGERAVFGPKTRDLGNRCKRGNVQRKLSGEVSFLQA